MRRNIKRVAIAFAAVAGCGGHVGAATAQSYPHAPITIAGGAAGEAEFHIIGDVAVITLRHDGVVEPLRTIETVNDALAVLADRRLSFAWQPLLAWTGDDLTALRDRMVMRVRSAADMGLPGSTPKGSSEYWNGNATVTTILQLSRVLADSGRRDESIAVLRRGLATAPKDATGNLTREFLSLRLADLLFESGDSDAAIALLEKESNSALRDPGDRDNIDINLAAILVRAGSYHRALTLVDQVWRHFSATVPADDGDEGRPMRVPGSEAHFAWIRACALNGLGQRDKARLLVGAIADDAPPTGIGARPTAMIARTNYFQCVHDGVGLALELARQLEAAPPASDTLLAVQPSYPDYAPDRATLAVALRQPALAKAITARIRPLEPQFIDAVRGWKR